MMILSHDDAHLVICWFDYDMEDALINDIDDGSANCSQGPLSTTIMAYWVVRML